MVQMVTMSANQGKVRAEEGQAASRELQTKLPIKFLTCFHQIRREIRKADLD